MKHSAHRFSSHTPDEKNEEESLSIGDESDNEDLTDRSDGEWSDSGMVSRSRFIQ